MITPEILIRDSSTTQLLTLAVSIINIFVYNICVKFFRCVYHISKVLSVYVSSQFHTHLDLHCEELFVRVSGWTNDVFSQSFASNL